MNNQLIRSAYELPWHARRMITYAQKFEPTVIAVCDRDARPIGRAIEATLEALECPLPSVDQQLHYRRITSKLSRYTLAAHLEGTFMRATELAKGKTPRMLVIDDHISTGATRLAFMKACQTASFDARVRWITYTGVGSDMSCFNFSRPGPRTPWRDRPEVIGVDYDSALQPYEVYSEESVRFYEAIDVGVEAMLGRAAVAHASHVPLIGAPVSSTQLLSTVPGDG